MFVEADNFPLFNYQFPHIFPPEEIFYHFSRYFRILHILITELFLLVIDRGNSMKEKNNPEQAKSAWMKPVITVLVRNNPEETVLTACKMRGQLVGPGSNAFSCGTAVVMGCEYCANLSSS